MADLPIGIKIEFVFEEEQTDCRPCSICHDIIVSNMHAVYLSVNGEKTRMEEVTFCESCKLQFDEKPY